MQYLRFNYANLLSIRFCISSLDETVEAFAKRTRNDWHVENKVHYVRYVTC